MCNAAEIGLATTVQISGSQHFLGTVHLPEVPRHACATSVIPKLGVHFFIYFNYAPSRVGQTYFQCQGIRS